MNGDITGALTLARCCLSNITEVDLHYNGPLNDYCLLLFTRRSTNFGYGIFILMEVCIQVAESFLSITCSICVSFSILAAIFQVNLG